MLTTPESANIHVYMQAVDMRKAIDGLSALVVSCLEAEPNSGDLFIFHNKQSNKIKCLFWDRNGFVMYYKRLDKGRFKFPKNISNDSLLIDRERLEWLLMGFDFTLSQTSAMPNGACYYY